MREFSHEKSQLLKEAIIRTAAKEGLLVGEMRFAMLSVMGLLENSMNVFASGAIAREVLQNRTDALRNQNHCPLCNKEVGEEANFCGLCGMKLKKATD